jgi:CubicO group peptidase (beta-lactamase class C family)
MEATLKLDVQNTYLPSLQFSTALIIRLCLIILATLNSITVYAQQAETIPVDEYVQQQMQNLHIPGLSLAVLKEGRIVNAKGYGLANLETNTPARPETVYKIASLSKPFIATAIILLSQEGKIGLDDKVSKYLDGSPDTWKDITIRHLLTHTSGIVRDPVDYHPYNDQPVAEVIKSVYPLPLSFEPGDKWLYSNVGYFALAEIITKASGTPWNEFIAERLFCTGSHDFDPSNHHHRRHSRSRKWLQAEEQKNDQC